MAFNIGLNVVEVDGRGAPALAGAPTSVAGFILRSRRGPTDQAVRVSNFRQFVSRFGGHHPDYVGAYCVDGFFLNGGQEAYVSRVVGRDSVAARVTLSDRSGDSSDDTLTIRAGYRNKSDVGTWGNDLRIDIRDNPEFFTRLLTPTTGGQPAQLTSALELASIDLTPPGTSTSRTLSIAVNGAAAVNILLDSTTLPILNPVSVEDIVGLINQRLGEGANSVLATVVEVSGDKQIQITTRAKGSAASLVLTDDGVAGEAGETTLDKLGFVAANRSSDITEDGEPFNEVHVASRGGLESGAWIRLDDGLTQEWHQITDFDTRPDSEGRPQEWIIWDAADSSQNFYPSTTEGDNLLFTCEFDLTVSMRNNRSGESQEVEVWEKLTLEPERPNNALKRLNDEYSGSEYVVLAIAQATRDPEQTPTYQFDASHNPAPVQQVPLTGGTDVNPSTVDYAGPTTPPGLDALHRFDTEAVQLLAVLDDFVLDKAFQEALQTAVTRAAIDYCAGKGDCMFVGHTPKQRNVAGAKAFGQNFKQSKSYGALYWPWITVTDPIGVGAAPIKIVPPTGHVMGVYARIDQTRGVWKAPAGNEAVVRGALAVEQAITDADHTDLVKNGSVNGIRLIRGAGIVIDSSRTLSTDTRWLYVNVRLLFNYVKASLRDGLRWVKQEPNRSTLWNKVKYNAVTPFLLRLYQAGAFGTGTPDEVFTVVCGPENNPPQEVDLGNLKIEVYFYPSKPAETIIIIVGQQPAGASASEQ